MLADFVNPNPMYKGTICQKSAAMDDYGVSEEVAGFLRQCFDRKENALVLLGRQQGTVTMLHTFLKTLRDVTVAIVGPGDTRFMFSGLEVDRSVSVQYGAVSDNVDLVIIVNAYFVPQEKLDRYTAKHYFAFSSPKGDPPELAGINRILDRVYKADDNATKNWCPPWFTR